MDTFIIFIFFISVVIIEILLGGSLIVTFIIPNHRIWPPQQKKSWQFYFTWTLTVLTLIEFIILGFIDWDSFIYEHFDMSHLFFFLS